MAWWAWLAAFVIYGGLAATLCRLMAWSESMDARSEARKQHSREVRKLARANRQADRARAN
jgi:hypothetical protein